MGKEMEEEKGYVDVDDQTQDGSVDLKGRPILRSTTGRWPACYFIVGYEVFERMAFYGIAANLVTYLTTKLHEGTVTSANNVTNLGGAVWMSPILGAYIADAHLGRYWTFVIASAIYLAGMSLLTLSVSLPGLRPPSSGDERASSFQVGIFYTALYIIAAGTGGTKPNISTMGADQFDSYEPKERLQKLSFFNWWMFNIFFGTLFANTFLVYIQDKVGWTVGYGLPTVGLALSVVIFLVGTPLYRHKPPSGSPLTKILRVLVAALRKWRMPVPEDPKDLYELSLEEYSQASNCKIDHTPAFRFLDKAAVKSGPNTAWMLCPITQVEETKQMIKMVPVLLAMFIPSTTVAQVGTLFVRQGSTLDRSIGPHFDIPPACLSAFTTVFMLISLVVYDRIFVPVVRRRTNNPRGITLLQRMGVGLVLLIGIMVIASLVERKRLNSVVEKKGMVPLSIFVLMPQFALTGVADAFVEVAKLELFYDQAPQGMKSMGTSYFTTSLGMGSFLSSFILRTVSDYTARDGRRGWVLNNLNESRLDYYYAFLAVLSIFNFLFFLLVANFFVYNVDVVEPDKGLMEVDDSPLK